MSQLSHWTAGSQIVYREVWRGRIWTARPVTVVQDTPDLIALSLCSGTRWKISVPPDESTDLLYCKLPTGNWRLADATWKWDSLILIYPGEAHAVHVMRGENREFVGWYINLQEPLCRTAIGFDFMDQDLDIVVEPDLSKWVWKDESTFAKAQDLGIISEQQAREIRAEGERVIRRIQARAAPFDADWENWFPPVEWPIPSLPEGWDKL